MPLPHFTGGVSFKKIDPVLTSQAEVKINIQNSEILTENLSKIEGDILHFNLYVNVTDFKTDVLNKIHNMVDNKEEFELEVNYHNKSGEIVLAYIMKKCKFVEIMNLIDVNYENEEIKNYRVRMIHGSYKIFNNKTYKRFVKVKRILKT